MSFSSDTDSQSTADGVGDEADELGYERLLAKKNRMRLKSEVSVPIFEAALRSFQQVERIAASRSVLEYWEENKNTYPLLYPVAQIVHQASGTQVSVERLFSDVRFIFSEKREKLKSCNIENTLLVRNNFEHINIEKFVHKITTLK